jgi:hypothetical protein
LVAIAVHQTKDITCRCHPQTWRDEMTLDDMVLSFDPFQGDETDSAPLSDKMVVCRGDYTCHWCGGTIAKGERVRTLRERNSEEQTIETFRFCSLCCTAMTVDDGGDALESRAVHLTAQERT